MSRFHHSMRFSRWAFSSFWSIFVFILLAAPHLHSQENPLGQDPFQQSIVQATAASTSNSDSVTPEKTELAPATKDATDEVEEEAQNPEPQTQNNPNPAATYQPVTWKNLPIRILGDQKLVWLFPMHVAQGQHLFPTLGVVGATSGLVAADSHIMVHLRRHATAFDEFDEIFSGTNTGALTALIPATFYMYGLVRKSSYSEQTALLIGEAYVDSAIPHVAIKLVSRRLRPNAVPAANDFTDTFFKSHVSVFGKGSSFPSGHAAGIFSVATVVAERYRRHKWVPWVAYGLAGAISFSRVPTFAHFPSDVFLGAALGYTITRFDVLRDRTH